jgi:hypothetical protein
MHQSSNYYQNPQASKSFQKFANLFPNVTPNVVAAAVSSLNSFSIESLLAAPIQQQQRANFSGLAAAAAVSAAAAASSYSPNNQKGTPFSPNHALPSELYGLYIFI